jgi:3-oxoacyl-[acyl-carrier protein] reductase
MDLGLSKKVALVLGGSSGLGFAIAKCLSDEGARVAVGARPGQRLDEAVATLNTGRGAATAFAIDLHDQGAMTSAEEEIRQLMPDILVCNSGGPPPGAAVDSDLNKWRPEVDAMLLNQIRCIRAALPNMMEKKWGRILVIASSGIIMPIPNLVISNSLRSALVSFAKTLSVEVAAAGVTVNTIVPGRIATSRVDQLDQLAADREKIAIADVRRRSIQAIPAGRYGDPQEFASVAAFLVSDQANYVTGQVTRVDGGFIRSI